MFANNFGCNFSAWICVMARKFYWKKFIKFRICVPLRGLWVGNGMLDVVSIRNLAIICRFWYKYIFLHWLVLFRCVSAQQYLLHMEMNLVPFRHCSWKQNPYFVNIDTRSLCFMVISWPLAHCKLGLSQVVFFRLCSSFNINIIRWQLSTSPLLTKCQFYLWLPRSLVHMC